MEKSLKFVMRLVLGTLMWYLVSTVSGSPLAAGASLILATGWTFGFLKVEVD